MLTPLSRVYARRVQRTMESLAEHNMQPHYVGRRDQVVPLLQALIQEGEIVSFGGSQTLDQCEVLDFLRQGNYQVLDRYAPGLTPEQTKQIFRDSFSADVYLSSVNAVTEDGWLYAVDGNGNRVAALIYGPDKVVIVAGINKIVRDLDEASLRVQEIAGPANAIRLGLPTPCCEEGLCQDCQSDARICCSYVAMGPQRQKNRIHVILVGESLGY